MTGYEAALAALDAAPGQLADARAQIAQQEKTLVEGEAQLAAGEAEYQKEAAVLREAEKEIASGKTSLSMAPALAQLQMQLAEEQLEEAKAEVTDGKAQLEEAKQQLADGKAELDDAKQQLADGEQALAELEVPEWFLLTRSENVSYASFEMNIEKVDAVAKVFPVFFFLVAALVALTTMTRMVEEDRLQIGTLKALGYGKGSIMAKYLLYALAASVLGSAFGLGSGPHPAAHCYLERLYHDVRAAKALLPVQCALCAVLFPHCHCLCTGRHAERLLGHPARGARSADAAARTQGGQAHFFGVYPVYLAAHEIHAQGGRTQPAAL